MPEFSGLSKNGWCEARKIFTIKNFTQRVNGTYFNLFDVFFNIPQLVRLSAIRKRRNKPCFFRPT